LVAAAGRRVLHVVEQLAGIVDLGARGGIDFQQIDATPGVNLAAARAFAAGLGGYAGFAVQTLRQDTGDGRLADAARAGEQERMVHAPGLERIDQRTPDVLLPDQLGKFLRAPFARQRGVAHLDSSATLKFSDREAARTSSCLRHPTSPLPLLPSGPDGIHDWSSRRSRCEPPSSIGESGLRPFR